MKGWPDYTKVTGIVENYDEYGENYPIGIGDGAARLGSIKTYDMRGRVYWMDNFEAPTLHWGTNSTGGGGTQSLVSDCVRNGEQSLGLTSSTPGGSISYAWRTLALPRHIKLGMETHFSQEANFGEAEIKVILDNNVSLALMILHIYESPERITYTDRFGAEIDTGLDPGLSNELSHFHAVKLAIDYEKAEWMRILWDDQELDMAGIPLRGGGTINQRYLYMRLAAWGDGVNNARICFDDTIITTMEPE